MNRLPPCTQSGRARPECLESRQPTVEGGRTQAPLMSEQHKPTYDRPPVLPQDFLKKSLDSQNIH